MEAYKHLPTTRYKDGKIYIHSSKKFCQMVDKLPDNAEFWKEVTSAVPVGIIAKEVRKNYTVYHVHKKWASKDYFGKHLIYRVFDKGGEND